MNPHLSKLEKLHVELARDVARQARNQILIDRMRTPTRKDRFMIYLFDRRRPLFWLTYAAVFVVLAFVARAAHAEGMQCPEPGQKCKVLYLSEAEERILVGQNGILDTAAQARNLDLGQFAVFMKTRIAGAVQGEVKPVPTDKPVDQK